MIRQNIYIMGNPYQNNFTLRLTTLSRLENLVYGYNAELSIMSAKSVLCVLHRLSAHRYRNRLRRN